MTSVRARITLPALLFTLALTLTVPCHAATDDGIPDATALSALEAKVQQAKPREQAFLYAQLMQTMTEIAGRASLAGDSDKAAAMLKRIEHLADLMHQNLTDDARRLKETEMLMHQTTRHMGELMHEASSEDRAAFELTLKRLNKVQDDILAKVFQR